MPAQKKSCLVLVAALCAGLAAGARGQIPQKPDAAAGKAQGPAPLRELFQDLDANGDRVIEKHEVPESGLKAFDTLLKFGDTNHDGKLEAQEYRALLERVNWTKVTPPEQRERRFKSLDRNEDGKLDRQEFAGAPGRFETLDRNGDGFLSRDEIPWLNPAGPSAKALPAAPRPPQAGGGPVLERLKAMDQDGDGRISRDEFTGRPALFDRLDTNHDGYLDQADRRQGPRPGAGKQARPEL